MPYIYLIGAVVFASSESIMGACYNKVNKKMKDSSSLYSFLSITSMFAFWLVIFFADFSLNWNVIWYALLFACFYTLCNVCMIRALKIGPVVLTSLFMQLSLVGTTVWGFIFWDSKVTVFILLGLVLVVVALWLCLYQGKKEESKINAKWLIYALLAFIGNAGCSITQRTQQIHFNGMYGTFLMVLAMAISAVICLADYLKSDKINSVQILKKTWYIPTFAGIFNGVLNLCVILLASSALSVSLIYPVISIGSLMLTTIFSAIVFREKMYWWQWVGVFIGMISVGILSI